MSDKITLYCYETTTDLSGITWKACPGFVEKEDCYTHPKYGDVPKSEYGGVNHQYGYVNEDGTFHYVIWRNKRDFYHVRYRMEHACKNTCAVVQKTDAGIRLLAINPIDAPFGQAYRNLRNIAADTLARFGLSDNYGMKSALNKAYAMYDQSAIFGREIRTGDTAIHVKDDTVRININGAILDLQLLHGSNIYENLRKRKPADPDGRFCIIDTTNYADREPETDFCIGPFRKKETAEQYLKTYAGTCLTHLSYWHTHHAYDRITRYMEENYDDVNARGANSTIYGVTYTPQNDACTIEGADVMHRLEILEIEPLNDNIPDTVVTEHITVKTNRLIPMIVKEACYEIAKSGLPVMDAATRIVERIRPIDGHPEIKIQS